MTAKSVTDTVTLDMPSQGQPVTHAGFLVHPDGDTGFIHAESRDEAIAAATRLAGELNRPVRIIALAASFIGWAWGDGFIEGVSGAALETDQLLDLAKQRRAAGPARNGDGRAHRPH